MKRKVLTLACMSFFILVIIPQNIYSDENLIYFITLDLIEDEITVKYILVKQGYPIIKGTDFRFEILSFKGDILDGSEINVPLFDEVIIESMDGSEQTITKKKLDETYLALPYYPNTKTINIYNNTENQLLLSIDVSKFAKCNENDICEEFENIEICPQDCGISNRWVFLRELLSNKIILTLVILIPLTLIGLLVLVKFGWVEL